MSSPTKWIVDDPIIDIYCDYVKCFYTSSTYCIYFYIKLFSQSEDIFTNDEHTIMKRLSFIFALFDLLEKYVN